MAANRSAAPAGGPPPPVVLSVAGSDPSGGAGIQADLKTFQAFGVYGAAVITALTVQNTCGVRAVHPVEPDVILAQLDAVADDLTIAAAKIGLLPTPRHVEALAARLRVRPCRPLVLDPVLTAGSGDILGARGTADALRQLLPLVTLVTPNLAEAAALTGRPAHDVETMTAAGHALVDAGAEAVLVTGGHLAGDPIDVLVTRAGVERHGQARVPAARTHGTGCTLSAAIAAGLGAGLDLGPAIARARRFVHAALAAAPALGRGARPLDHRVESS